MRLSVVVSRTFSATSPANKFTNNPSKVSTSAADSQQPQPTSEGVSRRAAAVAVGVGVLGLGGAAASGAFDGVTDGAPSDAENSAESGLSEDAAILVVENYFDALDRADTQRANELTHPDVDREFDDLEDTMYDNLDISLSDLTVTSITETQATVGGTMTGENSSGDTYVWDGEVTMRAHEGDWLVLTWKFERQGDDPVYT